MMYRLGAMAAVLAISAGVGVSLGNATVADMKVRATIQDVEMSPAERSFDRGASWAQRHGIFRLDQCPEPDQYFLNGCISATSSNG